MKYIDLVAYPIMILAVYVLFGLTNWQYDPAFCLRQIVAYGWGGAWHGAGACNVGLTEEVKHE